MLPSLRLFIPPLRLTAAAMWNVVQNGCVHDYGMVEEFVSTITELVPELLNADQKAQLLLGLRARVLFLMLDLF
uniref:TERF1-interacting nuclear factor 2 N-terminal domain-containing protein n=1 Tax=Gouania willdenowi TaxID=441366 RepID=A0A8C5D8X1_GOUWI